MNNYVKPAIKLATVDTNGNTVSCGTTAMDMELIQDLLGVGNIENAFGLNEPCGTTVPLEMYCKFTSADVGATLIFWS